MKKWFIRIAILLIVVVAGLFVFAKSYMTKNYVVAKLEKSINSRVQVGELKVSLLGEVELVDVIVHERDAAADDAVPHDDREALVDGAIMVKSLKFKLSLAEIVSRKLTIESVDIDGVVAKLEMLEDGSIDVESYFDKPNENEDEEKRFNAKDHDEFVTEIKELNLTNIDVDLVVKKTQLLLQARGAEMKVSDIQVNPKKLETVNNAKIDLACELGLYSLDTNAEYGKLGVTGDTTLTIFNSESGDLEPDMKVNLVLSPDSYLTTKVPLINRVWDTVWRTFDTLAKFGVDKVRLPDRAEFRENQKISLTYKLGKIDLLDNFSVHMSDWEMVAMGGSEFNTGTDLHRADLKLYVSSKISKSLSGFLSKTDKIGKLLGKLTGGNDNKDSEETSNWMEDGRVFLLAESTGSLSKPKLKIKNSILGSVQGLLDLKSGDEFQQGADILKGFFK